MSERLVVRPSEHNFGESAMNKREAVGKALVKFGSAEQLLIVYHAGPAGFGLQRELVAYRRGAPS